MSVAIPASARCWGNLKNKVKTFYEKPMISHVTLIAQHFVLFDYLLVSSNDDEIFDNAKKSDYETSIVRPVASSDNFTATSPVLVYALKYLTGRG